ncbi:MAG: glycoside hydrolase 5 family protein [Anaerolineales bacterium]
MSERFVLGVNYWPRRKAMYWWKDFDAGEVREEFTLIADLGLSVVRMFLLWEVFQPTPDSVDPQRVRDLVTVANIADEHGLKLDVTFFTGHMSGPNWAPGWLLSGAPLPKARQLVSGGRVVHSGYRNPYVDEVALAAEELQLRTVVGALKGHAGVGTWNLGNEPDLFAWPPSPQAGRAWVQRMVNVIRATGDTRPITCGLHTDSVFQDNGLRVNEVFAETDFAVMHAYPMYSSLARGPLDPDYVPFMCALTTALCGKPTLMQEFGGCTVAPGEPSQVWEWTAHGQPRKQFMASEEDLAAYFAAVLPKLVGVGATGAVAWCFADYIEALWDKPPCDEARHERFFGLVRPNGTLKPHAEVFRQFAATQPTVRPAAHRIVLDISPQGFYQSPSQHTARFYKQFLT